MLANTFTAIAKAPERSSDGQSVSGKSTPATEKGPVNNVVERKSKPAGTRPLKKEPGPTTTPNPMGA